MNELQYLDATKAHLLETLESADVGTTEMENAPGSGRVLDIGCGIGQALLPLAVRRRAYGIGMDISPTALRMARQVYAMHFPDTRLAFLRATAHALPFRTSSFDIVNCNLVLPYIDNAAALAEVARVLRPDGVFLVKSHRAAFYLRQLWHGLRTRDASEIVNSLRVLIAGTMHHLTRRQPSVRFFRETFHTPWLLRQELARHGLAIEREIETDGATCAFAVRSATARV